MGMKLLGGIIVLIMLAFGFMCIWTAFDAACELITVGVASHEDAVTNWLMTVIVFLCGMGCFATAPAIINEM